MKKEFIAYWVIILFAFIAYVYFALYVTKVIADDSKDFSWTVRSAEIIDEKEAQNEIFRQNIEELNKLRYENRKAINAERCKLEKLDKNAVCEGV